MNDSSAALEGGCACGAVRYRMNAAPMFVHCCHCTWCQTETGSAFVINALVETDQVEVLQGEIQDIMTPSASGKGQLISRCAACKVALWSHFGGAGEHVSFVRAGTLDHPARCPPDIHLFTTTRLPWVNINDDKPVMDQFYRYRDYWPAESFTRLLAAKNQ